MPLTEANLHQKMLTGARATCWRDGVEIGHATDLRGSVNIENIVFYQAGNPIPAAIVPVGYGCNFTVGFIRLVTEDVVEQGLFPSADPSKIRMWPAIEFHVQDDETGEVMFKIIGAMPQSYDWSIGTRSLCSQNASYQARYMAQPSEG